MFSEKINGLRCKEFVEEREYKVYASHEITSAEDRGRSVFSISMRRGISA